jgi:DNA-binding beta-propeller fold protein YncE
VSISPDGTFALVADFLNNRIRRVVIATGSVTTLVGSVDGYADGVGTQARFSQPCDVSVSPDGTFALVTDRENVRIRRVSIATGSVTTLAGSVVGYADGVGTQAAFNSPSGVSISPDGTFALVADGGNNRIRRVSIATGNVTTLAGSVRGYADGVGTQASFRYPYGVSISPDGTFALVADGGNNRIRRVSIATGSVTTLAGGSVQGYADGVGTQASFDNPSGVSISPDGTFALVADHNNHRIRRVSIATGNVTTLAGSVDGYADGVGTQASFSYPYGVSISPDGTFALVADYFNNRIRKISLASTICSAGFFCPAGSSSATASLCPAGSYCPSQSGSPVPCTAGYYCPDAGLPVAPSSVCSPGSYCPAGSSSPTVCPTGSYCASAYLSAPTARCPPSKYCIEGATSPSATCFAGYTCNNATGMVTSCSVGSFCSGSGVSVACPSGSYCPVVGLSAPQPCTAGFYCATVGLTSVSAACPSGAYCPSGMSAPVACPVGSYCPVTGLSVSVSCTAGSYCSAARLIAVSGSCPMGKYSLSGQSECTNCTSGSVSSASGMM